MKKKKKWKSQKIAFSKVDFHSNRIKGRGGRRGGRPIKKGKGQRTSMYKVNVRIAVSAVPRNLAIHKQRRNRIGIVEAIPLGLHLRQQGTM